LQGETLRGLLCDDIAGSDYKLRHAILSLLIVFFVQPSAGASLQLDGYIQKMDSR